jgi:tight adherence protein B
MTTVLAGISGALGVAGLIMVVVGLVPTTRPPRPRPTHTRRARPGWTGPRGGWSRWRWPVAAAAGLIGWLVTGWPVAAGIAAMSVVGLPVLLGTAAVAERSIARLEAIEEWTRRLADILVTGAGLGQAIVMSLRTCPELLRPEVGGLVARLDARWTTEDALLAFAVELDDAGADLVVAALVLASRSSGPGLARVLTSVGDAVAQDVAVRRTVEAERAKPRATARAVTFITLGLLVVGAFNRAYLAPYSTPLGQLVLALIAAAFVGCLMWMRALTLSPPEPRFVTGPARDAAGVNR